jgi:hypothetical protein
LKTTPASAEGKQTRQKLTSTRGWSKSRWTCAKRRSRLDHRTKYGAGGALWEFLIQAPPAWEEDYVEGGMGNVVVNTTVRMFSRKAVGKAMKSAKKSMGAKKGKQDGGHKGRPKRTGAKNMKVID